MYVVSMFRHGKALAGALLALCILLPWKAEAAENHKPAQLRLGTASIHLGWSSAAGNLDSDDKVDFAVADRMGHSPEGYNYRLQLTLSQEQSQIFHFRSTDSALNLSIVDLDHDADLDVVLTHALSGEIAGVWLNNGSGGFQEGNTADFSTVRLTVPKSVTSPPENIPAAMANVPLRKNWTASTGSALFSVPITTFRSLNEAATARTTSTTDRSISSRAPPSIRLS
jgi:hypothetical protein